MIVQFDVTTDRNPDETSWYLKDFLEDDILHNGGPYNERGEQYQYQFCVKRNGCYVFAFKDSEGDGLDSGNFGQEYNLSIENGDVLVNGGGQFNANAEYTLFGTCTG